MKYYDEKGEVLLLKKMTSWGAIQYEVYKVASNEFATELNYDQLPKLLIITTTTDRINIEHYIPGATWENRINKLAEDKLDGKDQQLPKIKKAPRIARAKSE